MNVINEMNINFSAKSVNESFARSVVSAFVMSLDPTIAELSDIKTAVSEAVTNSIIHGYEGQDGRITILSKISGRSIYIEISDQGCGISDVKKAMEPMFTTRPKEDRSGMGFSFMEAFMDRLEVQSTVGLGTVVKMWKEIGVTKHHFE
jgi:stage II sporulation protein AB (anti-sigma F factor)